MSKPVQLAIEKGIATLRLNRPRVHNVVDGRMIEAWETSLDRIEANDEIHTIILTASGHKSFCAGSDLRYFAELDTRDKVKAMAKRMCGLLNRLYQGSRVVIAAINGNAYGGGCEILTACHFRIAAENTCFQFRQSAMGVVTGWGGGPRLFRMLGKTKALNLLLTGDRIDADHALAIGLIDRVAFSGALLAEAHALARKIGHGSPRSVRAFLELARFIEERSWEEAFEKETELFTTCWDDPWFHDAVARFLQRSKGG